MGLPYLLPRRLQADPYGPSPLVTDLSITSPRMFAAASERGSAPTLFASGDLPPFTASGVDPELLKGLPYHWRHAAASEPSSTQVLAWLEQCAMDHDSNGAGGALPHRGLSDYQVRMEGWTRDLVVPDLPIEDATYPDWFKNTATRRAEAKRAEEQRIVEETERLRAELAAEHQKWPVDNQRVTEIVEAMAALRGSR